MDARLSPPRSGRRRRLHHRLQWPGRSRSSRHPRSRGHPGPGWPRDRGVAEQAPLIATALVERLEQGTGANEVAQLLLGLEPWAAERLLKGMPPEALAKVEEALRDPAGDAPTASVRALAEAVLSVRAAA